MSSDAKADITDRDSLHQSLDCYFYGRQSGNVVSEGFTVINLCGVRLWLPLQQQA